MGNIIGFPLFKVVSDYLSLQTSNLLSTFVCIAQTCVCHSWREL